jgi:DNA polymerase-3 subunit epsilon
MHLVFDTETTGLPNFRAPSDEPSQPHVVQFAAILLDDDWTERAAVNLIVRPDGWTIPDDVAKIPGITTDIAMACGVPEAHVVSIYHALTERADVTVAHNIGFDRRIMRIAMLRSNWTREFIEAIEGGKSYCTMEAAKPLTKCPLTEKQIAAGFTGYKAPKLEEAIRHFFGEDLAGAHDAMVDVRACARIYRHLHEMKAAAA